jgi:hypothetical protein
MSKKEFIDRLYRVRREGQPQNSPLRFKATLFADEQSFSDRKVFATGEVSLPNDEFAKSEFHPDNAVDLRNFPLDNGTLDNGIIELADRRECLRLDQFWNEDDMPEPRYCFDYMPCYLRRG